MGAAAACASVCAEGAEEKERESVSLMCPRETPIYIYIRFTKRLFLFFKAAMHLRQGGVEHRASAHQQPCRFHLK